MKALLAIVLFVAAACLLWLPFDSHTVLYGTGPKGAAPAGEIRTGFRAVQQVHPVAAEAAQDTDALQHCFAIRFATYARHNDGSVRILWRQGQQQQQWQVEADDLIDNSYRHFCPNAAFSAYRPYRIEVLGVDGEPGKSATFWLVDDARFGTAQLPPGEHPRNKSMALQGSAKRHTGPAEMVRIDRGAWLIGWLCTLIAGIVALASGFGAVRNAEDP